MAVQSFDFRLIINTNILGYSVEGSQQCNSLIGKLNDSKVQNPKEKSLRKRLAAR
jgi:hypothetical protein